MRKAKQPRKPAPEPPFEVGDKVRFKGRDSAIYEVITLHETSANLCMVGTDYFELFRVPLHELTHASKR